MKKSRNITVKMVLYNRLSKGRISLGIKGRYGPEKLVDFSVGIIIPEKVWDTSERIIKQQYRSDYKKEHEKIVKIKEKADEARDLLAEGKLHKDNAEDFIMNVKITEEDSSVLEFVQDLKQTKHRQYGTLTKHIDNIRAFQNLRCPAKYKPLMFSHLDDPIAVDEIERAVLNAKIKQSYKRSQLVSIQLAWAIKKGFKKDGKEATEKLFSNIPPEVSNPTPKESVSTNQLMDCFTSLNTLLQFEAVLFWLYSMSLNGLDGIDLVNLDDGDFVQDTKDLDYYHPNFDRWFGTKKHIRVIRSKAKIKDDNDYIIITRLWNLFPVMYLKMLLDHTTRITHPKLCYKGPDRLKLFNFYTRDKETRMTIKSGYDRWKAVRYQYGAILKEKLGATVQFTRATSAELASEMLVSETDIDTFLGHSNPTSKDVSRALGNYLPKNQLKVDTDQIFMLKDFDIVGKISDLVDMYRDKTELINNKRVRWIPDELLPMPVEKDEHKAFNQIKEELEANRMVDLISHIRWNHNLMNFPLTQWSKDQEIEYQKFQQKYSQVTKVWDRKKRQKVEKKFGPEDWDDRFKELIKIKHGAQDATLKKAVELFQKEAELIQQAERIIEEKV